MFLDFGIGILVSVFSSYFFKIEISIWLILFSIACAVLPDADFLYFFPKRNDTKYDHKHRDFIHYPLLYLPLGTMLLGIVMGKIWAVVFLLASFFHFLHDSIGIGWGVKWLFPFSKNSYSFFYIYSSKIRRGLKKVVFVFNKKNLPDMVREHGDKDWVKNIYYKWHPYAQVEFAIFIISIIVLYFYAR